MAKASAATRRRATTELGLLVIALLAVLVAAALVELSQAPEIPEAVLTYGAAFLVTALAAHIGLRRLAPGADPLLLPVAVLLTGLGLVMVRRIDFAGGEQANFAANQVTWAAVAVLAFLATLYFLRDHASLDSYRYLIGIGSLLLLLTPLLPVIGREVNGARIWLSIGGLSFQPVEAAKLGFVIFFASYLSEKRDLLSVATTRLGPLMLPPLRAFGPLLGIWVVGLAVLGLQNDLGPTLLLFGVFIVMLYIATGRLAYPVIGLLLAGAGAVFAYQSFGHVQSRVAIWLDVWSRYDSDGFQLAQSLFAIGTGGITGVGLGQGQPDFVPFVRTDFIFSAFAEETGLLGTTAILLCFVVLIGRGFRVALQARDDFGSLLAAGLTSILALQVFVIVGGVTRLIPLTGITLPFVSYGGSSLLANFVIVALLARISAPGRPRRRRRRAASQEMAADTTADDEATAQPAAGRSSTAASPQAGEG